MALDDATPAAYRVEFTIPCAPVAKQRARVTLNGTYTPSDTRSFETHARLFARTAMGRLNPTADAVMLEMVAFVPIPKSWSRAKRARALAGLLFPTGRPDLDNYEKAVTDALNGICYEDDSQICDVVKSKRYSDTPSVFVTVRPIDGFNADPFYVTKCNRKRKTKGAKKS
jgi:Holliday junction resolvase RusA-like endonuclease